jgi:hypothetical protein
MTFVFMAHGKSHFCLSRRLFWSPIPQSSIHSQGFRSLDENEDVEYDLEQGNDGRLKAVNVTGPNGDYVKVRDCPLSYLIFMPVSSVLS